ncbi:DUF58 domain-containing protein [Brachybacterium sp. EF45031]|uniref:DUF58 domain-containing protein n=1 Tax=Brachybacterium sillae TaxID=2810536 RepID=UPI00217CE88E|nr:DUF58 domain-containing protein [Brachybacterium sillae]MCS6711094.1 DUF58 domain-containing protein [Brachybacterium sillae]
MSAPSAEARPPAAAARLRGAGSTAWRGARTGAVATRRWAQHRVRPVLDIISPWGWAVVLVAALAWALGLLLHVTELAVLAAVLTIVLLVAALFILTKPAYAIDLNLTGHRVVAGERAFGQVDVTNPTKRPLLASRVELVVGPSSAQFLVPRLAPDATHEEPFAIPTRRRTVLTVGPIRSVRDDPLSLMRRQVRWTAAQEVYVHPRTVRLDDAASGYLRDLEGTPSSDLSSSDIAFHALRDYVPGDDLRHVHWRTTARTGQLMVRQFEETRRSHVVVALDNARDRFTSADEFELAISAAASLGVQTLREEKELTALSIDGRESSVSPRHLLDDYTLLEARTGRHPLHELGRRAADGAPTASAVFLVVGAAATPRELNSAARQLPPGLLAVAVRCEDGAELRRSRLGDLHLVTVGRLQDLPRGLRAVSA